MQDDAAAQPMMTKQQQTHDKEHCATQEDEGAPQANLQDDATIRHFVETHAMMRSWRAMAATRVSERC
jgi:hypothetical protein